MPRTQTTQATPTTQQQDALMQQLAAHPGGLSVEDLLRLLGTGWQRRTVQRRLAELLEQGRAQRLGAARAARYVSAPPPAQPPAPTRELPSAGTWTLSAAEPSPSGPEIPLSADARATQALVRRPRHLREPVPFRQAFLEQYHPNQTAYLPADLRQQLRSMGQSPAQQTPAGTFAKDILNRLLIDLSWASSQLEGNTYSRLDTERLIAFGQAAEGKDALETQMILNHKQAIEYLVLDPQQAQVQPQTLLALHALLSDGLMADPAASGRLRRRPVEIGGSVYLPLVLPQQLEELFHIVVQMAAEIIDPFEQAFFLMVHLPYLQAFEDVNKRVSRLAANIPLIRHNLSPLAFIDVPQPLYVEAMLGVYELNRVDLLRDLFVWAYGRSCQQYVAIQQNLITPDTFRLRHRQALSQVIASLIRQGAPTEANIQTRLPASIPPADQPRFTQLVLSEITSLHAGNVVRFGVGAMEWEGWQKSQRQSDRSG